jgi:diguanylate cyclase (GGDEF)-like protein
MGYRCPRKVLAKVLADYGTCYQSRIHANLHRQELRVNTGIAQKREAGAPETAAMAPSNNRKSVTSNLQGFRHSLQLLEVITSWHLWDSTLMLLLLPVTIVLVALPSLFPKVSVLHEGYTTFLVQGLVGVMWAVSGFTLYHERRRLKMLRKVLVEQMDSTTKSHVKAEKFYGLSILDPLTGLYNRRFGTSRLEEEIGRADESEDPLLLLAIDFDKFKQINDVYGHAAGDLALKEFSRRLQRAIRACDVPVRVGGDEFLVILPECPPDKVQLIWSRMGSIKLKVHKEQIPLLFSHGMAQYQVGDTVETMIKRADERLYIEKAKRKSAVEVDQDIATQPPTPVTDSEIPLVELPCSDRVDEMSPARVRRSGRLSRELEIFLIGNDLSGRGFIEQTNTSELSRHGAGVVSRHKLAIEQEIIVRCQETNREAEARVVRVIESQSGDHIYGLEFVGSPTNIWDVEVPLLTESEKDAYHLLFECSRCNVREMLDNSEIESSGEAINTNMERSCKRCASATTWTRVLAGHARTRVTEALAVPS